MAEYKLGAVEMRFADLIWENEPVASGKLVKLCEKELDWKKSTMYTVLKRLCERGIFANTNGVVTSLISKQDFLAKQSEEFVEEAFDGSLPRFLAAFSRGKKLSEQKSWNYRK